MPRYHYVGTRLGDGEGHLAPNPTAVAGDEQALVVEAETFEHGLKGQAFQFSKCRRGTREDPAMLR